MTASRATTHRLGPVADIPPGEGRAYAIGDEQIAVFHLRDGALRATQSRCPHAGGPLADGQVDQATLVCPLHLRAFSFGDGRCAEGEIIQLYKVRIEDEEIVVDLS